MAGNLAGAAAPVDPTTTAAWAQLVSIAEDYTPDLRTALAADPDWVQHVTLDAAGTGVELHEKPLPEMPDELKGYFA